MPLNSLASRFQCTWQWETLVMLCDGRIVCGCADPYAKRVLGDARTTSIEEIWTGPPISRLRQALNGGSPGYCGDGPLKRPLEPGETPTVKLLEAGRQPSRLYVECT